MILYDKILIGVLLESFINSEIFTPLKINLREFG